MDISYLIQMTQNKITILSNAKSQAYSVGDFDQLNAIDKELLATQNTFAQLELLAQMNQAAQTSDSTVTQIVETGLAGTGNSVQGPSASAIINGYDISAYATDALYEQKIQNLLAAMPVFASAEEMDAYIQDAAPGSLVTAEMVLNAIVEYGVDQALLLAIMQNDSNFGTLGVGARTYNPGNVGNTGTAEHSYASWQEGVTAVAEWLSRHTAI